MFQVRFPSSFCIQYIVKEIRNTLMVLFMGQTTTKSEISLLFQAREDPSWSPIYSIGNSCCSFCLGMGNNNSMSTRSSQARKKVHSELLHPPYFHQKSWKPCLNSLAKGVPTYNMKKCIGNNVSIKK